MNIFSKTSALLALLLSFGLLAYAGCDALEEDPFAAGQIQVLLTDIPLDDVDAVWVTIERVELIGQIADEAEDDVDGVDEDGEIIVLSDEDQTFDLLELQNGETALLAEETIPEGEYAMMRLIVSASSIEFIEEDGSIREEDLFIPSGAQTGIKIPLPQFTISESGDEVLLTLDFDASKSIKEAGASGMFIMTPVIQPIDLRVNDDEFDLDAVAAE